MSKEILNKDPRPKCRAHDERTSQLARESKTRDPKLDTLLEADVQAVRGMTPLRDGPPQWRPRQSHLAQRPGREKEKHADTAAPHTEQHQALRSQSLTHSPRQVPHTSRRGW